MAFLIFSIELYFALFRLATLALVLGRRGHRPDCLCLDPAKIGAGPARSAPLKLRAARGAHIRRPSALGIKDGMLL